MTVDPSLIAAYRSAHYWVEVDGKRIELRVGERAPALDEALARRATRSWALLTAHNPRSQRRSDAENEQAQHALERELASSDYELLPAHGGAEYGWSEASVVALGINETQARRLMRAYGQNGCLFGYAGAPAALRISKLARELTEAELSVLVDENFETWFPGLELVGKEVRIGKLRLDLVADERREGPRDLVVIELETEAHHGTLGQLLLYRHALAKLAPRLPGSAWSGRVRSLLVTTHLDENVVEIAGHGIPLELKVCVDDGDSLALVDPRSAPKDQVRDQAADDDPRLEWRNERIRDRALPRCAVKNS